MNSTPQENITTHKIEEYLKSSGRISDRVISLLNNYRKDWRNPSTHDHSIEFKFDEAAVALSSVSVFTYVFISDVRKEIVRRKIDALNIERYTNKIDLDGLSEIIISFDKQIRELGNISSARDLEAALLEYLTIKLKNIAEIVESPILSAANQKFRPDILISIDDKKYIIELKMSSTRPL